MLSDLPLFWQACIVGLFMAAAGRLGALIGWWLTKRENVEKGS